MRCLHRLSAGVLLGRHGSTMAAIVRGITAIAVAVIVATGTHGVVTGIIAAAITPATASTESLSIGAGEQDAHCG
jgi:hypothetical protein